MRLQFSAPLRRQTGRKNTRARRFLASLANLARPTRTPIMLPVCGHIAAACRFLGESRRSRPFGEIDRASAYKSLPAQPADFQYSAPEMRCPVKLARFCCRAKTLAFGSQSPVLHYICFPRALSALLYRILNPPTLRYIGDFGLRVSTAVGGAAMHYVAEFRRAIRIALNVSISEIGYASPFVGAAGTFPPNANGYTHHVSVGSEKADRWVGVLALLIFRRSIPRTALESIIGRPGSAQPAVLGRFARARLKPIYENLYARRPRPEISDELAQTPAWRNVSPSPTLGGLFPTPQLC